MNELNKLERLCNAWGGSFLRLNDKDYAEYGHKKYPNQPRFDRYFSDAPFDKLLSVDWPEKKIVFVDRKAIDWPAVVHEMGHVFCSLKIPDRSDEWDFLGWEYAVAKLIRGNMKQWFKGQDEYAIAEMVVNVNDKEFRCQEGRFMNEYPMGVRKAIIAERYVYAKKVKLVSKSGIPLAIR